MKIARLASTGEPWFAVCHTLDETSDGEPKLQVDVRRLACWATYSDGQVKGLVIGANGTPQSAEDGPLPFHGYARSRVEAQRIYRDCIESTGHEDDGA